MKPHLETKSAKLRGVQSQEDVDLNQRFQMALDRLSHDDRCFLALYFLGGLKIDEIAATLSIANSEVDARFKRALKAFRAELSRSGVRQSKYSFNLVELQSALSTCLPIPPGLEQRVMAYVFGHETQNGALRDSTSMEACEEDADDEGGDV